MYTAGLRTVYWGYRGTHGVTEVRMVGVPRMRGGTGEQYGENIKLLLGSTGVFP